MVLEGNIEAAADMMIEGSRAAVDSKHIIRQYIFPFVLEDIYHFQKIRDPGDLHFTFDGEIERISKGPNIHLRGTAFRLVARSLFESSGSESDVREALDTSIRYLRRSGDPVEHAKSLALLAQLELACGNSDRAAQLARSARPHLIPYGQVYFRPNSTVWSSRSRHPDPPEPSPNRAPLWWTAFWTCWKN